MKRLKFVLGFHNHQPIGNFDFVIDDAVERAYLPFLEVLEKSDVRIALHYSGALLEWLENNRPEVIEKVKELSHAGKVEVMSGGFYEPILAVLPSQDREGQILKQNEYVRQKFNYNATGLWLAERIWEPHLPKVLNQCNIKYVVVDDTHFKMAGFSEKELYHYFETEEEGYPIYIFPISQKLRYYIPFEEPEVTIEFLRSIYENDLGDVVVMADDGEKFGIWPGTYELVYKQGWLEKFFKELTKHKDWLEVVSFDQVIESLRPAGNVYLPTASYTEMTEWALSTEKQELFEYYLHSPEIKPEIKQFMRGGFWRNFFHKYSESNLMHKRMLDVSSQVHKAIEQQGLTDKLKEVRDELWRAQTNCPYWHGVFGGLYLPHIRSAVFEHLINAEKQVAKEGYKVSDYLKTGDSILKVSSENLNYLINIDRGASLVELDFKKRNHNVINVMTRRRESYHKKLFEIKNKTNDSRDVKTIHDLIVAKEEDLDKKLIYDKYPRVSFKEWILSSEISVQELYKSDFEALCSYEIPAIMAKTKEDEGEWNFSFVLRKEVEYRKAYKVNKTAPKFKVQYDFQRATSDYMVVEINVFLPTKDENLCWIEKDSKKYTLGEFHSFDGGRFSIIDNIKEYKLSISPVGAEKILAYPIETVSNSEAGFESVMQGLSINILFSLKDNNTKSIEVELYGD